MLRIGTAGWNIPRASAQEFPETGSGLQRYATRFRAAEINVTFYRLPRPQTLSRWTAEVPDGFSFAVKVPKAITHERRLVGTAELLEAFLSGIRHLGAKLGPLLIQLPPSLAYDTSASGFFGLLRARHEGPVVCEPRHVSWFGDEPSALMLEHRISRVAADPARHPEGEVPGGWPGLVYFRLHGSPRMYFSAYGTSRLTALAQQLLSSGAPEVWCIFDNTASGAALQDALELAAWVCVDAPPEPTNPDHLPLSRHSSGQH